jgi:hypothetical protein
VMVLSDPGRVHKFMHADAQRPAGHGGQGDSAQQIFGLVRAKQ